MKRNKFLGFVAFAAAFTIPAHGSGLMAIRMASPNIIISDQMDIC